MTGLGASGIVYCNTTGYDNDKFAYGYYTASPERFRAFKYIASSVVNAGKAIFEAQDARDGLFFGFLIITTIVMVAIFSMELGIVLMIVSLVMLNILGVSAVTQVVIYAFSAIGLF